jgi:uncharacterized membrane protein YeaQ/YmgE (transglycosylase-associated protein family)
MLQTIINLVSGLAGGNIAVTIAKKYNPGILISSICGLVGGGLGGACIHFLMKSGSDMDAGTILGGIAWSFVTGALLTVIAGFVKSKMDAG